MQTISYPQLIQRLADLTQLAEPPLPGECSGTFSSYDRRSRYDAKTDQYIDWDANRDGTGYIRQEGDSIVAFEAEGPGVIWRVWSAMPEMGHIRIFVDGDSEPIVDMPFRNFFERLGDDRRPLNFPELTPTLSRGRNSFIPIPYNQSCKVLFDHGWGAYYHFTYTTFPQGTALPHYSELFAREALIALATVDRQLADRGRPRPTAPDEVEEKLRLEIPAGQSVVVCNLSGNRAITRLAARPDLPPNGDAEPLLRQLTLSIKWDGEDHSSVWSPLGDFFGTAPGINLYRSLPLGMTEGGFYADWFMPFANRACIEVSNDGDEDRAIDFIVRHQTLERPAAELLRFHAKWHRDAFLEQVQTNGRDIDWPLLVVEGGGRFCGISLHVWNRWQEPKIVAPAWWYGVGGAKNIDWWWGEGDEKFYVDGEKFPSTFGTGSEDYIGYAWAAEPPFPTFESAFACQPTIELDANGHSSVNRFHICDNVPFNTSFEATIEKYKGNQWGNIVDGQQDDHNGPNVCLYDCVAFWYQQAGQSDPYEAVPLSERVGYYVQP